MFPWVMDIFKFFYLYSRPYIHYIFLLYFPSPTFIQGPMLIVFVKFSRPYIYSLPTYILDSRVTCGRCVKQPEEIPDIFYGWPLSKFHNIRCMFQRTSLLYEYRGSLPYADFGTWIKPRYAKFALSSGTVGGLLLMRKSPTCAYISQKPR